MRNSEDSDQTWRMPRLIWVCAGRTLTLLDLSCRGSFLRCFYLTERSTSKETNKITLRRLCHNLTWRSQPTPAPTRKRAWHVSFCFFLCLFMAHRPFYFLFIAYRPLYFWFIVYKAKRSIFQHIKFSRVFTLGNSKKYFLFIDRSMFLFMTYGDPLQSPREHGKTTKCGHSNRRPAKRPVFSSSNWMTRMTDKTELHVKQHHKFLHQELPSFP